MCRCAPASVLEGDGTRPSLLAQLLALQGCFSARVVMALVRPTPPARLLRFALGQRCSLGRIRSVQTSVPPASACSLRVLSPSLDATELVAASLAAVHEPGDLLLLRGEVGAGKTAFWCVLHAADLARLQTKRAFHSAPPTHLAPRPLPPSFPAAAPLSVRRRGLPNWRCPRPPSPSASTTPPRAARP